MGKKQTIAGSFFLYSAIKEIAGFTIQACFDADLVAQLKVLIERAAAAIEQRGVLSEITGFCDSPMEQTFGYKSGGRFELGGRPSQRIGAILQKMSPFVHNEI